jgi:response regulator NasT
MATEALRIMVVDENPQRSRLLEAALGESGYTVVEGVERFDELAQRVRAAQPDVVLIDVDAPGRDALEQVSAMHQDMPRPVVMFSQEADQQLIQQAIHAGVSAYVSEGISQANIDAVIDVARAHFQEYQALRQALEKARSDLDDRKIIDRAKGMIMAERGLSEPAAYRALQKIAMDRKRRLAHVAEDVIHMAELFTRDAESSR